MNNTHVDNRYAMQEWLRDQAIEQVTRMKAVKELDLMPLWKDLVEYQMGEAV